MGIGLQARFEVVKSNEDDNTPPCSIYMSSEAKHMYKP
jgi:hypothetical protein